MTRNRNFFGLLPFLLLFMLSCKQQPLSAQTTRIYDLVKDFKAVPDDRTDNYQAFVKAAETLSRAGGGQLNIPNGKYYIAAYKGNKNYPAGDIIFRNCNNLTIIGNNSVIRINGNFTRTKDYKIPGYDHFYSSKNTVCPIKLMNCKNVLLKDLVLYGEVNRMKKESVAEGESYGVVISDDEPNQVSSKIFLQNITSRYFAADGFLIKSNGRDITLNKCNAYNNARQGLSIVKGRDIKVLNSNFDSTGKTGSYGWHAPGAGIDVENEFGKNALENVLIRNCNLRGNNGFQIVTTLSAENVVVDSCFISDNTRGYSDALNGVGIYSLNSTLSNSIVFASIQVDIADYSSYKGPAVQQITRNIIYSGNRGIVSADFGRPVNVTDNIFVMLPKPDMGTYFPYIQNSNCVFNRNIVVVHADRVMTNPTNQVTALVQWAKEAKEDFWLVNGYNMPLEKQRSYYFMPATNQAKIVNDHFFGVNDISGRYEFNKTHGLTHTQVRKILDTELFTAYRQTYLDKKYIVQANTVRSYARSIVAAAKK
jgi:hypothetical protein